MPEVYDRPKRAGDDRSEVPAGFFEPRGSRSQGFVWYVKADIRGIHWRERAGPSDASDREDRGGNS